MYACTGTMQHSALPEKARTAVQPAEGPAQACPPVSSEPSLSASLSPPMPFSGGPGTPPALSGELPADTAGT